MTEEFATALMENTREPLLLLDADLRVQGATAGFYHTFFVSHEETKGRRLYDLGNGQWDLPPLRELVEAALLRSEPFQGFELEHDFPTIGRRVFRLNGRQVFSGGPGIQGLLLAIEDITPQHETADIRFRRFFEAAKDGMAVLDAESGVVEDVNAFLLRLTGLERAELIGKSISDIGARLGLPEAAEVLSATRKEEIVRYDDLQPVNAAGQRINIDVVANRYQVGTRPVIQLNIRDVTARREAAKALTESQERLRLVIESVRDYAIFQMNDAGNIVTWNIGAERLLGWSEREVIGRSAILIFTPEDVESGEAQQEIEQARTQGQAQDERWHMRKDGSRFFASGVLSRVPSNDGEPVTFTKVMQDITKRQEQEEELRRSLEEKSTLVREIHHRVKNNLQVLVSLLSLQASYTTDPHVLAAFEETESRVRAIAQIHEQLYTSHDLTAVEIGGYLARLARELVTIHVKAPGEVELDIEVQEMMLHIEKAIPVGLIANELIFNSLKHGLRKGWGSLRLTFEGTVGSDGTAWARLRIHDSGPGIPSEINLSQSGSMGYQLITLLVRQLRAQLSVGPGPGANVAVEFPVSFR